MSQDGPRLRCRTGLSPGLAPRALFQVAVPFAASVIAHAAVVATLPARGTAPVVSAEPPTEWVEAPEPVNMDRLPYWQGITRATLIDMLSLPAAA
jgi:hypothetical protein